MDDMDDGCSERLDLSKLRPKKPMDGGYLGVRFISSRMMDAQRRISHCERECGANVAGSGNIQGPLSYGGWLRADGNAIGKQQGPVQVHGQNSNENFGQVIGRRVVGIVLGGDPSMTAKNLVSV
ncbi:hypothetical protein ACH5RR_003452 [Cinchona calisaya]|uniref:Uncharacterized protein n=1 Tax=Cinchona calisaya TaxID=153742 RepID=A0ABD3AUW9_9GENT